MFYGLKKQKIMILKSVIAIYSKVSKRYIHAQYKNASFGRFVYLVYSTANSIRYFIAYQSTIVLLMVAADCISEIMQMAQ